MGIESIIAAMLKNKKKNCQSGNDNFSVTKPPIGDRDLMYRYGRDDVDSNLTPLDQTYEEAQNRQKGDLGKGLFDAILSSMPQKQESDLYQRDNSGLPI